MTRTKRGWWAKRRLARRIIRAHGRRAGQITALAVMVYNTELRRDGVYVDIHHHMVTFSVNGNGRRVVDVDTTKESVADEHGIMLVDIQSWVRFGSLPPAATRVSPLAPQETLNQPPGRVAYLQAPALPFRLIRGGLGADSQTGGAA